MKNPTLVVVIVAILGGCIAYYFHWQYSQPKPELIHVQNPPLPPPPSKVEVRQVIDAPPAPAPLLALAESDNSMLDALAGLIGNKTLMKFFHTERIIHNIVATIDNLPRRDAPMNVMPVEQARGGFITASTGNNLAISPRNAARYRPYVSIAKAIDSKRLVEVYTRLYPLFQQAYEELGYPKKYFNDRLIEVIDNLLDAPAIKEPIRLVQPHVLYLFANPDLEGRSIGQRILLRIGSKNEAIIKTKLHEIKQELMLHMHEKKMESAG